MVLLNPSTGITLSADSQTGTWYEETAENTSAPAVPSDVHGRKSQRLDTTAPKLDDIALSSIHQRIENTSDDSRRTLNPASTAPEEPHVDDATLLLGISWQQIGQDEDVAAAVRGWKKFIDNEYATYMHDSRILMKNRALNAYLVAARPMVNCCVPAAEAAFYLFTEDLMQAQLVETNWERTVQNLRASPISFQGTQVLQARNALNNPDKHSVLDSHSADADVPLLQSLSAAPGPELNGGVGMGTGMEIDS